MKFHVVQPITYCRVNKSQKGLCLEALFGKVNRTNGKRYIVQWPLSLGKLDRRLEQLLVGARIGVSGAAAPLVCVRKDPCAMSSQLMSCNRRLCTDHGMLCSKRKATHGRSKSTICVSVFFFSARHVDIGMFYWT